MSTPAKKKMTLFEGAKIGDAARVEWCESLGLPLTTTLQECRAIRAARGFPPSKLELQFDDARDQMHPAWRGIAKKYSPAPATPAPAAPAASASASGDWREGVARWNALAAESRAVVAQSAAMRKAAAAVGSDVGRLAELRAEISSTKAGPQIKGKLVAEAIRLRDKIDADLAAERAAVRAQMDAASPEVRSEIFQRNKKLLTGKTE